MEYQNLLNMINILNNKVDDLNRRLNDFIINSHGISSANIDYIALMTDVELPSGEDFNNEGE